jgi:hypothetical protein
MSQVLSQGGNVQLQPCVYIYIAPLTHIPWWWSWDGWGEITRIWDFGLLYSCLGVCIFFLFWGLLQFIYITPQVETQGVNQSTSREFIFTTTFLCLSKLSYLKRAQKRQSYQKDTELCQMLKRSGRSGSSSYMQSNPSNKISFDFTNGRVIFLGSFLKHLC